MDSLVTIRTANYPHELMVLKSKLESAGIDCFLKDLNTVQLNPLYSNMIGGVKLQVKESELEIALELLKDYGYPEENLQPNFIWKIIHKLTQFKRKRNKT